MIGIAIQNNLYSFSCNNQNHQLEVLKKVDQELVNVQGKHHGQLSTITEDKKKN